jgi:hypothetical protein
MFGRLRKFLKSDKVGQAEAEIGQKSDTARTCQCGCGAAVTGRQKFASDTHRKRASRAEKATSPGPSRDWSRGPEPEPEEEPDRSGWAAGDPPEWFKDAFRDLED